MSLTGRIYFYGTLIVAIAGAAVYGQPAVKCFYNPLGEQDLHQACLSASHIPFLSKPLRLQALYQLNTSYMRQGRVPEAINAAEKASILDPGSARSKEVLLNTFFTAGQRANNQKEYVAAADYYTQALSVDARDARVLMARAMTYQDMKNYDAAIADYDTAFQHVPATELNTLFNIYIQRGRIYDELQSYDDAARNFTKAIQIRPEKPFAYGARAAARSHLKDYAGALQDAEKAIEIDPNNSYNHFWKVDALNDLERFDDALTAADQWEKAIGKKSSKIEIQRGYALGHKGYYKSAIEAFDRAIALDPKDAYSYYYRGFIKWRNLADAQGAIPDFEEAVALGNGPAAEHLAEIRQRPRR